MSGRLGRGVVVAIAALGSMGCSEGEPTPKVGDAQPGPTAAPRIVAVTAPADLSVLRGDTVNAALEVRVDAAYHVMANPASFDYLVPLRLELAPSEGLEIRPTIYPQGVPFSVDGIEEAISTYEGSLVLTVPVTATSEARAGREILRGTLYYQGCSQHTCLIPSSLPVEMAIEIVEP